MLINPETIFDRLLVVRAISELEKFRMGFIRRFMGCSLYFYAGGTQNRFYLKKIDSSRVVLLPQKTFLNSV